MPTDIQDSTISQKPKSFFTREFSYIKKNFFRNLKKGKRKYNWYSMFT